ncbi:MAG: hypothetical protein FWG88_07520 [Oscillospiraceae bacterium]|nr:hypothetical protein [Oscillospiraceae bacterium]
MKEILNSEISISRDDRITTSPASKGNQIKWRTKDGLWLKADDMGYEGLAEAVAARLLELSNIESFAMYDTCIINEDDVEYRGCVSKDFLAKGEQLLTIYRLYETRGFDPNAEFVGKSAVQRLESLIDSVIEWTSLQDFGTWLGRLLEFDAFILNEDRHLQNIAVILTEDWSFKLMPVFDNGAAFLSDTKRDYPFNSSVSRLITKVRSKPIVVHFDKQLDAVRDVVGLSLKFNGSIEENMLQSELYTSEENNRISRIINTQKRRYPHMF